MGRFQCLRRVFWASQHAEEHVGAEVAYAAATTSCPVFGGTSRTASRALRIHIDAARSAEAWQVVGAVEARRARTLNNETDRHEPLGGCGRRGSPFRRDSAAFQLERRAMRTTREQDTD